jgi:hypothetical protein
MAIAMRCTVPGPEEVLVEDTFVMGRTIELGDDSKPILNLVLKCTRLPARFAPGPEINILPCKLLFLLDKYLFQSRAHLIIIEEAVTYSSYLQY